MLSNFVGSFWSVKYQDLNGTGKKGKWNELSDLASYCGSWSSVHLGAAKYKSSPFS